MALKPPDPTTNNLPASDAKKQRQAAIAPVVGGLLLIVILAGALYWNRSMKVMVRSYITPDMTYSNSRDDEPYHPYDDNLAYADVTTPHADPAALGLLNMLNVNTEQSMIAQIGQPLPDAEPAGLPQPDRGQRLSGFTRDTGPINEELVYWKINTADIAATLAFYKSAAADLHFVKINTQANPAATASPLQAQSFIFTRSRRPGMSEKESLPAGNDVLVIRARPDGEDHFLVTVWYRYASLPAPIR